MKCRFGAARCRSLMQQLHAGVERKEQYKTFAIRTNLSTKGHLPSSSNSTAQDKLPSSRVLRQSSRLAAQSPIPLPGPQFSNHFEKTYLQVMRGFVMDFFSWICNGRPTGKKEEIWRMGLNETHKVHQATPPIVWAGNQYSPLLGKRRKDSTYGCALHSICQCRSRSGSETGRLSRQGA